MYERDTWPAEQAADLAPASTPTGAPTAAAELASNLAVELVYQAGFGNVFASEAIPGALPREQNSPRHVPYGLYAEQLNNTPFTVARGHNRRIWLYRIRPSVVHSDFVPLAHEHFSLDFLQRPALPNLLGWRPRPLPAEDAAVDFLDGMATIGGAGDPTLQRGFAVHCYAARADMRDRAFYDADGELLIVPETGRLHLRTELGVLSVAPGEIAVVPRGLKFAVDLPERVGRGLVLEAYARSFELPSRGVIGANSLADERHFLAPVARYEDRAAPGFRLVAKLGGSLYQATCEHSPFDVVAWHGSCVPYKYDLARFNAVGSISFDHPDPSIYTVLTAPLDEPGRNTADLVIFPPRWDVAAHTFRPPFYHRQAATELNAIITGPSANRVFSRGGMFLTQPFTAHGIAPERYEQELAMTDEQADAPRRLGGDRSSLWIQFESSLPMRLSRWAVDAGHRDPRFSEFSRHARSHFAPPAGGRP